MTNDERKRIELLRKNGNSFSRIAEITGLSRDSVRIYSCRNNIIPGLLLPAVRKGTCGKHRKGKEGVILLLQLPYHPLAEDEGEGQELHQGLRMLRQRVLLLQTGQEILLLQVLHQGEVRRGP